MSIARIIKKKKRESVLIINNSKIVFRNLKILTKSSSIKMVGFIGWFYAPGVSSRGHRDFQKGPKGAGKGRELFLGRE